MRRVPAPALCGLLIALVLAPWAGWTVLAQGQSTPTPTRAHAGELARLAGELDAAWRAQDWPEALRLIERMRALDPAYPNLREREYAALVNHGIELLTQNRCTEALASLRRAHALNPAGQEAVMGLELVSRYCGTPVPGTPTPVGTPAPGVPAPTPTPMVLHEAIQYTVRPGDTLFSLARRYGTTVQAIMAANGMMSSLLRAGSVIWIPPSAAPAAGPLVHIVQPGETLHSLARRYNTTVWAIMAANNLSSSLIHAYRALFIPTAAEPALLAHIVQPGETLYTIAKKHNTTVSLIMMANNLRTFHIYVYQRLVLPPEGWTGWPPLPGGPVDGRAWRPGARVHLVQRGDTLFSLARRYGTTVQAIMAANGLTSSRIVAGSTLRIP